MTRAINSDVPLGKDLAASACLISDEQRANVTLDVNHFQFPSGGFNA